MIRRDAGLQKKSLIQFCFCCPIQTKAKQKKKGDTKLMCELLQQLLDDKSNLYLYIYIYNRAKSCSFLFSRFFFFFFHLCGLSFYGEKNCQRNSVVLSAWPPSRPYLSDSCQEILRSRDWSSFLSRCWPFCPPSRVVKTFVYSPTVLCVCTSFVVFFLSPLPGGGGDRGVSFVYAVYSIKFFCFCLVFFNSIRRAMY